MRKLLLMVIISLGIVPAYSQNLQIISFDQMEKHLKPSGDTAILLNFWATWCKPCVEELPFLVAAQNEMSGQNIKFVFVSLDFKSQTEKVKETIKKLSMSGNLFMLNEQGGEWIDKLDKNWSGAIPYTILILPNGEKREHYDAFNSLSDLKSFLTKNLSN